MMFFWQKQSEEESVRINLQDYSDMSSPSSSLPRDQRRFRCFCGLCHVVTGTQACLVWYVISSLFSMVFGMRSTLTWLIVPICVTLLGAYALCTRRHKYLYPFLIITVVQQFVCVLMAVIIVIFSLVSFDTMRQIIGHSLDMDGPPTRNVALIVIGGTVAACLLLSIIHVWQAIVIYRCLEYYEDEYRKLEDGNSRSSHSHYDTTADSRTDYE